MGELIGYGRCSTVLQDLTAQREALAALGVEADRIDLDKGLTGTNRDRPGLDQALAAVRAGDTATQARIIQNQAKASIATCSRLRHPHLHMRRRMRPHVATLVDIG